MRLIVLVFISIALTVRAGDRNPPISDKERDELFAWFDRLPLVDVRGCKYVTVRTGG